MDSNLQPMTFLFKTGQILCKCLPADSGGCAPTRRGIDVTQSALKKRANLAMAIIA
jgi:hypothetical protein